ncbi:hypothetical protein E9993_11780 [Labilibacter sediminis]|nr:hypothetical protein E9993_11780 [Labilibacter sediminis]
MFKWLSICILLLPYQILVCNYRFENLNTKEGISLVRDIQRDSNGYLWIASSANGLMRYDGYNIIKFKHSDTDSTTISDDRTIALHEDVNKQLWVGTTNGLNRYIPEKDIFIRYDLSKTDSINRRPQNYINDIVESKDSVLWVLTRNGLFYYDRSSDSFTKTLTDTPLTNTANFTAMAFDAQGQYWLGCSQYRGLIMYNPKNKTLKHYPDDVAEDSPFSAKRLLIDNTNTFWYGNYHYGLANFDPETGEFRYFPLNQNGTGIRGDLISTIIQVDSVNIFVGIDQGGINIYNKNTKLFSYATYNNQKYGNITSDGIYCFHKDDEGIIWVGTSRGGIYYANKMHSRFKTFLPVKGLRSQNEKSNFISYNIISCFFEDSKGLIWIGTDGGGVDVFNRKTQLFKHVKNGIDKGDSLDVSIVRAIAEDTDGNIWIAPWKGDIICYNRKKESFYSHYFQGIKSPLKDKLRTFWTIHIDKKNRFWIVYADGTVELFNHKKEWESVFFRQRSFFSPNTKILELDDGSIYVMTVHKGIFRFNENLQTMENIIKLPGLRSLDISSNGDFWIGTIKHGVYHYSSEGKLIKHYTIEDGLVDNVINGIAKVDNQVWISTNYGLSMLDLITHQFINYNEGDGLQGNQFFMQSVLKTSEGELFFGGTNGFSSLNPSSFQLNKVKPKVLLTDMIIGNKKINSKTDTSILKQKLEFTKEVRIKWKKRLNLELHFLAINYTFPYKNRYAYKMIGFDSEWKTTDAYARKALYNYLDPGEYTFKVIASNNDGLWNYEGNTLKIIVEPPFRKTIWFYLLLTLFAGVIVVLIIIIRERKINHDREVLKAKVKERTKIIEDQYEELETQKEELQYQNEELYMHRNQLEKLIEERTIDLIAAKEKAEKTDKLKTLFLENLSHEIRTPMNAIVGFSSLLGDPTLTEEEHGKFIDLITNNCNSLLLLIEDIIEFSMIESDQLRVSFTSFPINNIINNIYSSFDIINDNDHIEILINNSLESNNYELFSDEFRIKQILTNLMNNALKFTEQGQVEIGLRKNAETIQFYVKDTGPGIPERDQDRIFDRFIKLEKDHYNAKRGLGLGLSISKRLAQILGANISLISHLNSGSEFILSFPMEKIKTEKDKTSKST